MKNKKTASVVVTYNRKKDLINCLDSIFQQSEKVDALYIIDNNSNDGTPEYLLECGVLKDLPIQNSKEDLVYTEIKTLENNDEIELHYVRKHENDGGAGGFYKGMKLAYEANFDWIWLMDDDGIADKNQLKNLSLCAKTEKLVYLNALVVSLDDTSKLAFGLKGYKKRDEIKEKNTIENFVNPFNGTLISKKVIDKIGLIKKEMFIWGDEREYTLRVKKNGYKVATALKAIHFHPNDKGKKHNVFGVFTDKFKIILKPISLEHIYIKNLGFIENTYASSKVVMVTKLTYVLYFLFRFKFSRIVKFLKYYKLGALNKY